MIPDRTAARWRSSAEIGRSADPGPYTIGVISDTHGLLRPEAVAALEGSHVIVHAGDVGSPEVLNDLRQVAPVFAVRGNADAGSWTLTLPLVEVVVIGGVHLYVLHDLRDLDLDPGAAGFAVVVSGHSHRPRITKQKGVLFLNPGSAGPRRFSLPVTLARVRVDNGHCEGEIVTLNV